MQFEFVLVPYAQLNARQRESYNFQKISAVLADYGFSTIRLSDDWNGADFIAQHISGVTLLVQLKSRLCVTSEYRGKNLWIAFPSGNDWFLFPHDEVLNQVVQRTGIQSTVAWKIHGAYSWGAVPANLRTILEPYRLTNENSK